MEITSCQIGYILEILKNFLTELHPAPFPLKKALQLDSSN